MDYEKLADLLYPNTKSPEYYEKMYPKRNLNGGLVTRFAPSPTGYLHIGNFFSAFIDRLIASNSKGVFYFRLEDTDKKREIEGTADVALGILKEYGIDIDEGLTLKGQKGEYGPYIQSQRLEIYRTYAKELVKRGLAFPCFCEQTNSLEQIKENRKQMLQENEELEHKDVCRNLSLDEIEKNLEQGKSFALRLKSKGKKDDKIITHDLIGGEREMPANCKDVVLIKNNKIPPYCFAHAVDDHLMRTSVVVRGNEWLASLPAHLEIFDALGFERVNYIHTPLICKIDEETGNKRKMSKRKDPEADMRYFKANGFPKEAVLEYLLTLANSNYEIWRLNNPNDSYKNFNFKIEKIGNSNPLFDMAKLCDISKNIIANFTAEQVYDKVCDYSKEFDVEFYEILKSDKNYAISVFSIDRNGEKKRKDFAKYSDFKEYFKFMFYENSKNIQDYELDNINLKNLREVLEVYLNIFDFNDDKQIWFDKIKNMALNLGYCIDNKEYKKNPTAYKGNVADVCTMIRIAITQRKTSPDLWTICNILKNKTTNKINNFLNILKN